MQQQQRPFPSTVHGLETERRLAVLDHIGRLLPVENIEDNDILPKVNQPYRTVVYFVQGTGISLVKIGWSCDLQSRLGTLQRNCPTPLIVRGLLAASRVTEAALHLAFASHRHHGEWFNPCHTLIELIDLLDTSIVLPLAPKTDKDGWELRPPNCDPDMIWPPEPRHTNSEIGTWCRGDCHGSYDDIFHVGLDVYVCEGCLRTGGNLDCESVPENAPTGFRYAKRLFQAEKLARCQQVTGRAVT